MTKDKKTIGKRLDIAIAWFTRIGFFYLLLWGSLSTMAESTGWRLYLWGLISVVWISAIIEKKCFEDD